MNKIFRWEENVGKEILGKKCCPNILGKDIFLEGNIVGKKTFLKRKCWKWNVVGKTMLENNVV